MCYFTMSMPTVRTDVQAIPVELNEHAMVSTEAVISAEKLNEYLSITKLGPSWCGTQAIFLLHCEEQMRLLEEMEDIDEHYTAKQKKHMLEAAVRGVDNLRDMKNIEEI